VPTDLERDLGLYATLTISIGAMIGSGIFVLPGKAAKIAGPSVILAYLLAGVLVLPAALSKSEMATAMPEAGGTYLYIDRALGPLVGTIAGVGAWFSIVFKSAFAIVGLGAYLLVVVSLPAGTVTFVGLGFAALLLVVNVVGVKQSGRLQAAIVSLVLLSLLAFIADGLTFVNQSQYHPFFETGASGLLAATGFVFVSYAGVTKIASVAEEVEDPGRNIPFGILASVLVMMLVYTFTVFVVVGVVPIDELGQSLTPMSLATGSFFGRAGEIGMAVVAVLALTSMANAGILSSSRFPLAMSRDALAPRTLARVSDRFRTPIAAIAFTGAILLLLIAFVPVVQLAKLASAFQILVFMFVNVALIAFRESELESYDPEFTSPAYPWVQLFGILGGLVLLTQMGLVPLAGAVGIVVIGMVWYRVYGRERTEREGAALDALRRGTGERALEQARQRLADVDGFNVLVPFGQAETSEHKRRLLTQVQLASRLVEHHDGKLQVVRFEEVPQQLDLSAAADEAESQTVSGAGASPADVTLEASRGELADSIDVPVEFGEIVTHDTKRSVTNFAKHYDVDLIFGEWHPSRWRAELLGSDVDWYMNNAPCDLAFTRSRDLEDIDEVTAFSDGRPFEPIEVLVADSIAASEDATLQLVVALDADVTDEQVAATDTYLAELDDLCRAETELHVRTTDDKIGTVTEVAHDSDLLVTGTSAHHVVYDVLFGTIPDKLVEKLETTVVLTHARRPRRTTFLRAVLERFIF
jgi:amino acid transporter/nucleotide-binding universal stress UspA family protein